MPVSRILIANRGEIAVRIARAAAVVGADCVTVFSEDDAAGPHIAAGDAAVPLAGHGPAAYLDAAGLVAAARSAGCDAVHPGYGFLSENAAFARLCADAGLTFIGPDPAVLAVFGDKARARRLAEDCGVPLVPGTGGPTSLEEATAFFHALGDGAAVMVKAVAGGGGRGMRAVTDPADLPAAFDRCRSEALAAFGGGDLYVEQLVRRARHIEIQIIGDGRSVAHLWERDCTLQRRHQKLVEIAPSPFLSAPVRDRIADAAVRLARAVGYAGLGTVEFLVADGPDPAFFFMEANPRLQVEHTVTEAVTGIDLVAAQILLAGGATLADLGLEQGDIPPPRGCAVQVRLNAETVTAAGAALPSCGTVTLFDPPTGPGVRVDTHLRNGTEVGPRFDSLLAKIITHAPTFAGALRGSARALREARVEGVATNAGLLRALVEDAEVAAGRIHTRFVEDDFRFAGDNNFAGDNAPAPVVGPADGLALPSPMGGLLVRVAVSAGEAVRPGQPLAVVEAMKTEMVLTAPAGGVVLRVLAAAGATVAAGEPLLLLDPDGDTAAGTHAGAAESAAERADLAELHARRDLLRDAARPAAVARRHAAGQRTARENVEDLCDPGSFQEYGGLAIAGQRRRRPLDELMRTAPADGLVAGIGMVNGARTLVMAYDYTVFAGTQGLMNHKKMDRMIHLARDWRLPVVVFAEGGGGRPGDTDWLGVAALDIMTFRAYAGLSGTAPRVGIASGRCFAGNAALLGCSDVIIATENASIGMGGPAMIEGGGLGVFTPEQVGPVSVQAPNGVIDILVPDEAAATAAARHYLSYFQGPAADWRAGDPARLRALVPENRRRAYDVRAVVAALADDGSVLEMRAAFAPGMVTALIRVEGRPMGLIANNPLHLGGAIDAAGADKAARFLQLCEAFGLPVLSLCDTPGFMVGPEAERTATVRHVSRLFLTAAALTVPVFTIVLRKGYGLGAQAMAAGSFHAPVFTVAWPGAEFGAMGIEGSVRLGYRRELEAESDPARRQALFDRMVAEAYAHGKAVNAASFVEIDDVIDPAESRRWIVRGLAAAPVPPRSARRFIDAW